MATYTETENPVEAAEFRLRNIVSGAPYPRRAKMFGVDARHIARGLGVFSIGLGLAETLRPRGVARLAGARDHSWLIRGYGARELAAGAGILSNPSNPVWLWARVAGDAVDLFSLRSVLSSTGSRRGRAMGALLSVAGVTTADILCAISLSRGARGSLRTQTQAQSSIIINRPAEEVYRFCRNFENLPKFLVYVDSVSSTGDRRSRWTAKGPDDANIEWEAEIVNDLDGRRISWRSLPESNFANRGTFEFERAPGNRGTIVRMQIDYGTRARGVGGAIEALAGRSPDQILSKDLRRLKQVLETGEVIRTEGQPAGRGSGKTWLDRIAG